jgi:hypothetical protein
MTKKSIKEAILFYSLRIGGARKCAEIAALAK